MLDPILYWNDAANAFDHTAPMTGTTQGGPTRSSRATALVHLAMHDAHFGVDPGQPLYVGAATFEMVRPLFKQKDEADHAYGDDDIDNIGFEFVSAELDGVSNDNDGKLRTRRERKFSSLADAMFENSVSRVFLGVHWRFDGTSGHTIKQMLKKPGSMNDHVGGVPLGHDIARDIFASNMTMTPNPVPFAL